jgi:predicted ATPase
MTEPNINELSLREKADAALRQAGRKVVEEAKRNGTSVVVWEDGKVREVPAEELPDPDSLM